MWPEPDPVRLRCLPRPDLVLGGDPERVLRPLLQVVNGEEGHGGFDRGNLESCNIVQQNLLHRLRE